VVEANTFHLMLETVRLEEELSRIRSPPHPLLLLLVLVPVLLLLLLLLHLVDMSIPPTPCKEEGALVVVVTRNKEGLALQQLLITP